MQKHVIEKIRSVLAQGSLSTDPEDLICSSYDGTRRAAPPEALVRPANTREVSEILKIAYAEKIPVYPCGARSGLTGGALPINGGIVLDFLKMNRILEVNARTRTATAQPGVILGDLQRAAEEKGLFYPPDPASAEFATLGGTLAECAGGLRCVKYGVTRDYVLALEAVLPTGEILRLGSKAIKNVVGYDVMRLIIGSEGTLAVITEATVRLRVLPEKVAAALGWFRDIAGAFKAVDAINSSGAIPRVMELMDADTLGAISAFVPGLIPDGAAAAVLVELDGLRDAVAEETRRVRAAFENSGAFGVREASDAEGRAELEKVRRNVSPALFKVASGKLNEDVSVPLDRTADVFALAKKIGSERGLKVPVFAHAGDGNVHVNFMYDSSRPEELKKAEEAAGELFREVVKMGGSISGEHGIGVTKRQFLDMELGASELALLKKLKALFDPAGILNPGKIFP
jgi:glycolate oxidase